MSLISIFKLKSQSNRKKHSYSPSFWDLLRNMVLARGWSDGLYAIFSSINTHKAYSMCTMIGNTCLQSTLNVPPIKVQREQMFYVLEDRNVQFLPAHRRNKWPHYVCRALIVQLHHFKTPKTCVTFTDSQPNTCSR